MKITRKNLEKIFLQCKYDPEEIGLLLLKSCGYETKKHFDGSISVWDNKGILFHEDSGVYIP